VSDRGTYKAQVQVLVDRIVYVEADGFDEAETLAKREVMNLVDGFEPEVLWIIQDASKQDDWPVDRADD
jgi:hypothetical protein